MGGADLRANDDFQALRAMNAAMISAYRLQDWESSMTANEEMALIAERMGIDLSEYLFVYETRIAEYRANPPGRDWDAVYVATEK
jgi:adenylate cyclase